MDASVENAYKIRWLILIYHLPREPSRHRVAVWRKLKALGALYLQDGAAALPDDAVTREQTGVAAAPRAGGRGRGDALGGPAQYRRRGQGSRRRVPRPARGRVQGAYRHRGQAQTEGRDRGWRDGASRRARKDRTRFPDRAPARLLQIPFAEGGRRGDPRGATCCEGGRWAGRAGGRRVVLWATRRGCHVDRTACIWLIRRRIDPGAEFRFFRDASEAQ